MNDKKCRKSQALQACCKIIESPPDTAHFIAQASANHRQFFSNVLKAADLIIVDVSQDHVMPSEEEGEDDFTETRLAGLIRQHSQANFLFVLEVADESKKSPQQLKGKLRAALHSILAGSPEIICAASRSEILTELRDQVFMSLERRLEQDRMDLCKACGLFYKNIEMVLEADQERHRANVRNLQNLSFLKVVVW